MTPLEARRRVYGRVVQVLIDEALEIPLYFIPKIVVRSKRVGGELDNLLGKLKYKDAWLLQ